MDAPAFLPIPGLSVGHFTDPEGPTGCTVLLCPRGAVAGVDVRGAAPGTRETDLLRPGNLVEQVHAILLAGGSAFGLDAASGVVRWLEERGFGLAAGPATVPIVPAAVLFDLALGNPARRPDAAAGYAACEAAGPGPVLEGSVGAGAGATVGKLFGMARAMRGGFGCAAVTLHGVNVAALVAVNAVGDVVDSEGRIVAGMQDPDGRCTGTVAALLRGELPDDLVAGTHTTLGILATDAPLDKAQCQRLAACGHDGLARRIQPVHTPYDGDTLFAVATGDAPTAPHPLVLGTMAAEAVSRAVLRAVRAAESRWDCPAAHRQL